MSGFELREATPREAFDRLDEYLVIDVRPEFEVKGPLGTVPGAERVERPGFGDLAARPIDRPLLVVCRSGRRSAAACQALAGLGLGDVTNLAGGMIAWNEANLPVERPPARNLEQIADGLARWLAMVTQTLLQDARRDLGFETGRAPTSTSVRTALDATFERLAGMNAPPDLAHTVGVFRGDLEAIAAGQAT